MNDPIYPIDISDFELYLVQNLYWFNTYEPSNPAPRGRQPRRNGDFASLINSIAYEFSFCKDFQAASAQLNLPQNH